MACLSVCSKNQTVVINLLLICAFLLGCGGRGSVASTVPAKNRAGKKVVTADGVAVNAKAHQSWLRGLEVFDRSETQGWDKSSCRDADVNFSAAIDAQDGRFAEALYMQGAVKDRCGAGESALKFYHQALKINPKLCDARSAIGLHHLENGESGAAQSQFARAIRDDPQCTEAYVNLAILQRSLRNESTEALRNLRRALAIESEYLPAFNQMALLYFRQGRSGKNLERLDLAEIVCKQATLLDASYAPIYNTWGLVKMERGRIIEALRLFEKAMQLDSKMFEAYMNFGEVTLSFRGYKDAKDAFDNALALQSKSYEARIGLGAAFRGLKQVSKAKSEYEKAMKIDSKRPEAYFNLAVLHQDYMSGSIEQLRKAKKFYGEFMVRAQNNSRYRSAIDDVRRTCQSSATKKGNRRKLKRSQNCRPGRLQNINTALDALQAAARMQKK